MHEYTVDQSLSISSISIIVRLGYDYMQYYSQIQSLIIDILVMYTKPEFVPQEEEKSAG